MTMRTLTQFLLLGSHLGRGTTLLAVLLVAAFSASADDYSKGSLAFQEQDYRAAAAFWRKAADNGSAEAKLQMGHLAARGLGMAQDPMLAFEYYLESAEQGLPEAAVNVGAMLDSGTGVVRDSGAASVWYARAALAGNARAAFQLGLMYQAGNGVPVNDDLAFYWLDKALDEQPGATPTVEHPTAVNRGSFSAPEPLAAYVHGVARQPVADLIWTAGPGSQTSRFAVQILSHGGADHSTFELRTSETVASALQVPVRQDGVLWRVARIDPAIGEYRVSPWQHQISGSFSDPRGLVLIVVNPGDARSAQVAKDFARVFQPTGLVLRVSIATYPAKVSAIHYSYRQDASLARDVAGFLPGFTPNMASLSPDLLGGPGEVIVNLVLTSVAPAGR